MVSPRQFARLTRQSVDLLCAAGIAALSGCGSLDERLYEGYAAKPLDSTALISYNALTSALTSPSNGAPLVRKDCFGMPNDTLAEVCRAECNQATRR
jgi:hypothetical protein